MDHLGAGCSCWDKGLHFFRCRIIFQSRFSLFPSAALITVCFLLFLHFFTSTSTCAFVFPSQPAVLEPPDFFPPLLLPGQICLISAIVVPVFCPLDKEATSSVCWWLFPGGVTPSPLRAAMLLSAACELRAVQSGVPGAGDCPLHLSRDGVQMCLTNDAGGLSYEFRTIWKAEKINSCLVCHCLRRRGSDYCWKQPSGRLPFKEKDEIVGVALVKNMLAPEIFTIDQPGNSHHQARWCLVYIK